MISRYLATSLLALPLLAAPLMAQGSVPADRAADRPSSIAPETQAPSPAPAPLPTSASVSAAPLQLRGGAVATGLHGFYDYQSNGGSPEYITIRPGEWMNIYTVFMNSMNGATVPEASASRRVGYAYSSDGGATWVANREITQDRLGYPDIEVSSEPVPYIATHGEFAGNQVVVYGNPTPSQPDAFIPIAELPVTAANGLADRGVIWPSFELNPDETKGILAASYYSDPTNGFNALPMQVATIDLATGQAPQRWTAIDDSVHSTTSGGRYVVAVSPSGRIGLAWYRFSLFEGDTEYGIYYSESTDGGTTWSSPQGVLVGEAYIDDFNIGGDVDTLVAGANIDGTYVGENLHLTFTGSMNALLQFQNILHWSKSNGLRMIARAHQVEGLGAYSLLPELRQGNMGTISYPTIAVSEDGQKIVVAFSAVDQRIPDGGTIDDLVSVANEVGFLYYRLWAVGSSDGGLTWGDPFVIQDHSGDGTDSASIEYPSAAPVARLVGEDLEVNLVFQGRRQPGQFAFTSGTQTPGTIEDVYQYFQRMMVTPAMFQSSTSVATERARASGLAITSLAPNPARDRVSIAFRLGERGTVRAQLVDNLGRVVATHGGEHRESGLHTVTFDLSGIAAGAYRVVIEENGAVTSSPVIVR